MGLFSRKRTEDTPTVNREVSNLGRDYAIAKRHGDRRTQTRILKQMEKGGIADADWTSFKDGQSAYDDIPPAYAKPRRRGSRRR